MPIEIKSRYTAPYYNLDEMTAQQVFDASLNHIRAQGRPAVTEELGKGIMCSYLDRDGNSCAAAIFLPREERKTADGGWMSVKPTNTWDKLVCSLQRAHDDVALSPSKIGFMERYEARMREVAKLYGLNYAPPQTDGEGK